MPFFFVDTGIQLHLKSITGDLAAAMLVPAFLLALFVARGMPVWLYGRNLASADRVPFALYSSVASLSLVVVITDIGVRTRSIGPHLAAALVAAALLSVLLFPTIAGALRPQPSTPTPITDDDDD